MFWTLASNIGFIPCSLVYLWDADKILYLYYSWLYRHSSIVSLELPIYVKTILLTGLLKCDNN